MQLPANVSKAEPAAIAIACVIGVLAIFGVWSNLGLTPDQVAELGALLGVLAALTRAWWDARKGAAAA